MEFSIKRERLFFSITWLRWILALIVGIALLVNRKNIALFIFILTALVGFFENFITRKDTSLLRQVLDFFADKLLVNITAALLAWKMVIPWWVPVIIFSRDLLTIIIGTVLLMKDLRKEFKPTFLGKVSYFFQLMALIQIMLTRQIDWYILSAALLLTVSSGIYALFNSEFKLARRKSDLDQFKITKLLKLADYFTLFNVGLGLMSIVFSISNKFDYAAYMLLAATAFDGLDGKVAAMMKQQNTFGKELDSLADTVSFGVAPALFGFSLMQDFSTNQMGMTFGIIAFTIFLFCGILRLARYNIMDLKGSFSGMPITLNGIIIPIAYFLNAPIKFYPYIYLMLGVLMVSTIRIKKLKF